MIQIANMEIDFGLRRLPQKNMAVQQANKFIVQRIAKRPTPEGLISLALNAVNKYQ